MFPLPNEPEVLGKSFSRTEPENLRSKLQELHKSNAKPEEGRRSSAHCGTSAATGLLAQDS